MWSYIIFYVKKKYNVHKSLENKEFISRREVFFWSVCVELITQLLSRVCCVVLCEEVFVYWWIKLRRLLSTPWISYCNGFESPLRERYICVLSKQTIFFIFLISIVIIVIFHQEMIKRGREMGCQYERVGYARKSTRPLYQLK